MTTTRREIQSFSDVILFHLQRKLIACESTLTTFSDLWRICKAAVHHLPNHWHVARDRREFASQLLLSVELLEKQRNIWAYRAGPEGEKRLVHIDLTDGGAVHLRGVTFMHTDRMGRQEEQRRNS